MATNRSFDAHKAVVLERILRAWEKCPDLNFGELLDATCIFSGKELGALNDQDLCDDVERFALLGSKSKTLEEYIPEPVTDTRRISDQIHSMCYHKLLRAECAICKPPTAG